jgi:predicted nuclease of predicted toxin-antitoxin system
VARFKVDENLPAAVAEMLRAEGHDAMTVLEQGLGGRADLEIHRICRDEGRAILTLDRGFGDPRRHPTTRGPGVIVLRPPSQDRVVTLELVRLLIARLDEPQLEGSLWIVEPGRIRIRRG